MLVSMTVRNIALIEQLQIEFQKGMQVLSGETGAGKSVICLLYTSDAADE